MSEKKSGFDFGEVKPQDAWVEGEFKGKNSKVVFDQARARNPNGTLASGTPRNRTTVTFNQKLLKAKLGEDRYKKLLKARRRKEPAPARYITPKDIVGTYQHAGGEAGYLACPIPSGMISTTPVSPAMAEIIDSVRAEPDFVPSPEFADRERMEMDRWAEPFTLTKGPSRTLDYQFGNARLGLDTQTETIWKERGSDFNGMAEHVMSWRYFLSTWGFVYLLTRGVDKIQRFFRTLLWKATGSSTLFGPFSLTHAIKMRWQNGPGTFWARGQKFGFRPVIRHWLVKTGRLNPPAREVEWKGQQWIDTPEAKGFLAAQYTPAQHGGVTPVLEKARELGVDALVAVKIWAAHTFNDRLYDWSFKQVWERELSKLKDLTIEKARADWIDWHTKTTPVNETPAEKELRIFVVTMLADSDPPEKPVPPKPEHIIDLYKATSDLWNSCVKCRGTKKFWDSRQNRYVECDVHGEKATKQAVVEVKDGMPFIRCPDCNTFDAHILSAGDYRCDGCAVVFNYDGRQK